ncbi:peritrophin-1-like [Homalodisca vitripennis]|nr:peritrophin-1-like [Homalodisca vitripennis]KAG8260668.1 Belongs to the glycosyl hydrolase 18 [Homalodisca vitripennis]
MITTILSAKECMDGQFSPDPTDCARYYECNHGKLILRDCGPGTYWNPAYNVCDWPYNVDCKPWSSDSTESGPPHVEFDKHW